MGSLGKTQEHSAEVLIDDSAVEAMLNAEDPAVKWRAKKDAREVTLNPAPATSDEVRGDNAADRQLPPFNEPEITVPEVEEPQLVMQDHARMFATRVVCEP